jgi:hypothetical protein
MNRLTTTIFGLLAIFASSCKNPHGEIIQQEPNPHQGYNFPYLLFIPEQIDKNQKLRLIVEPNNTGYVSDDFDNHVEGARQIIENTGHIGKFLADSLKYPLLVPIFPRSEEKWETYTHALDRDAIKTDEEAIKRIDLQLISMIDAAKIMLNKMGYAVHDKVIMTGFSASATFTNRFTFIHPEKIKLCIAGGLNSMLILPVEELNGTPLKYPLGTHDFTTIFRDSVHLALLKQVPQFLFMGGTDDNDAVLYDDAYDMDEREIVFSNFGKDLTSRWIFCGNMYKHTFDKATIKTYDETGHTINDNIRGDALEFARKWILENEQ